MLLFKDIKSFLIKQIFITFLLVLVKMLSTTDNVINKHKLIITHGRIKYNPVFVFVQGMSDYVDCRKTQTEIWRNRC